MTEQPRVLYHGTGAGALPSILASGLRPRGGKNGNWEHSVTSNPRAVYLTDAYPLHFAVSAARRDDELLVLEISVPALDPAHLAPDEDFLEQATRRNDRFAETGDDMKSRTRWFRRRASTDFAHHWRDSLRGLGTCTYYGTILPRAIVRWATVPVSHPLVRMSDPTITLMNYRIMGGYYRQLTRHIFGDPLDLDDAEHMRDQVARVAAVDRAGISVGHSTADQRAVV